MARGNTRESQESWHGYFMMKKQNVRQQFMILLSAVILLFLFGWNHQIAEAAVKEYGIIIVDSNGTYSYYDLNGASGSQKVELSSTGKIMIPLKKVCSYFSDLTYQYDFSTGKAEIVNALTGKRLVLQNGSKYAYVYAKGAAKGTKVTLSAKSYISEDSKALMVDKAVLKYSLKAQNGYHYYKRTAIQNAGFDSELKSGIMVYDLCQKAVLPNAEDVRYISDKAATNIVKVTIPEGYCVPQIVNRLVSNGVCQSSHSLYSVMEKVDFSKYTVLSGRSMQNVCFALEGYLYPDTYEFYKNSEPADVIAKILSNSEKKLAAYMDRAEASGYTLDEILCYASIIEKEASSPEVMAKVSSVLHTRISIGMKLQCDATTFYVERYMKPVVSEGMDQYVNAYSSYRCLALPAGPICCPGKRAIEAALNPDATAYLYFGSDDAGNYYFAKDNAEAVTMRATIAEKNEELKNDAN